MELPRRRLSCGSIISIIVISIVEAGPRITASAHRLPFNGNAKGFELTDFIGTAFEGNAAAPCPARA